MPLKFVFFHENFDFFLENYQNFQIFKIFEKNRIFKKIYQTSKCSKKFAFWVMIKQKKLQRDFVTKITIVKKI